MNLAPSLQSDVASVVKSAPARAPIDTVADLEIPSFETMNHLTSRHDGAGDARGVTARPERGLV